MLKTGTPVHIIWTGIHSVSKCVIKASIVKLHTWQILLQDHSLQQLEHPVYKKNLIQEHNGGKEGGRTLLHSNNKQMEKH